MRFCFRQLTCLMLALVIGLTSVQLAAARGQPPAVGTVVICTGTGPVHILVDETGQPTGGVMVCPDYATAFFADIWAEGPVARRVEIWQDIWIVRGAALGARRNPVEAQARGPPISV